MQSPRQHSAKILEFVSWDAFFVLGNDLNLFSYETVASGRYQKGSIYTVIL